MPVEIVVLGARGRMGQMVLAACAKLVRGNPEPPLTVIGAIESKSGDHPFGQQPVFEGIDIPLTDSLEAVLRPGCVVIDFTSPEGSLAALDIVERAAAGHVLCTTGFSVEQKRRIQAASRKIPLVFSPNMSIGVTVLFKVAETVARALGEDFDAEIIEAHHNQKKDAPSGTALGFAEAVARGLNVTLEEAGIYGRQGLTGVRPPKQIGIHAVRAGDIAGDHTVLFAGAGERIELKHMAHNRQPFAQGAIRAALFLKDKPPGLYTMVDVLGL